MKNRALAVLSLLLLVPVPSLGAMFGMMTFADSVAGRAVFAFSKIWLFLFPVFWLRFVEKKHPGLSPVRNGGLRFGLTSGFLIGAGIAVFYLIAGGTMIDRGFFIEKLKTVGLLNPVRYALGAAYWILINSVLEEYVWRWFCVRQCEVFLPRIAAILASALFFTLHHIIAMSVYFSPVAVALCSFGVFCGGVIWSYTFIRYRSVWPGYISHAVVDLVIFGIGAVLLFG